MAPHSRAPAFAARAAAAGHAAPPAAMTAAAGDDFFDYVNGDWMARTEIPADRSSWGAFAAMAEDTNARIVKLIEGDRRRQEATPKRARWPDYYPTYMDEAASKRRAPRRSGRCWRSTPSRTRRG